MSGAATVTGKKSAATATARQAGADQARASQHLQRSAPGREAGSLDSLTSGSSHPIIQRPINHPVQRLQLLVAGGVVQGKLKVGQPGDRFEREADRMAALALAEPPDKQRRLLPEKERRPRPPLKRRVREKPEGAAEPLQARVASGEKEKDKRRPAEESQLKRLPERQDATDGFRRAALKEERQELKKEGARRRPLLSMFRLQRQAKSQEKEEPLQAKAEATTPETKEKKERLQAQMASVPEPLKEKEKKDKLQGKGATMAPVSPAFQSTLTSTKGSGAPLPESTQAQMESRLGHDFSGVKVHTGPSAVELSSEINAQAFTHQGDIYFNQGKFDTGSSQGQQLLAHELTHTIQQGASLSLKEAAPSEPAREERLARQEAAEEKVDTEAEIAASEKDAREAVDPRPAAAAQQQAEQDNPEAGEPPAEVPAAEAVAEKPAPAKSRPAARKAAIAPATPSAPVAAAPQGEAGQYLVEQSAGVCGKAEAKSRVLADHEQTHEDAAAKQEQTEAAVEPPAAEGQSQSNNEQVASLDDTQAPQPDQESARQTMNQTIEQSVPKSIEEVNEFKSQGKGKIVGSKVLGDIKKDTDAVTNTYGAIEQAPAPKAPESEPVQLPETEAAPGTAALDLGKEAVPELQPEHTDASQFDRQSDDLMNKEGIKEEQLDMVDEGELLEAKKDRQTLKTNVAEQPAQIRQMAQQERQQVRTDLRQEEKQARGQMRGKRQRGLGKTKERQEKTKSELELKRERVAQTVNGTYEAAKTSVTTKLGALEKQSLKAFDDGQAAASTDFEEEVNREIKAWKRRRYSGWFGGAKWLKDKFFGIDDFPEVKQIFETARSNYIARIDRLILAITAENNRVIKECKDELAAARVKMQQFVAKLGPELKSAGKKALTDMQAKLAEMDGFIDRKQEELAKSLCDKKAEAIKKIDEKIEKMKEEMSGLVGKLGKLLLNALLKFFKWVLKKAGFNVAQLMSIIEKGIAVIKKIVTDPIGFIKNLIGAVKGGIERFQTNIKKHLVAGLIGWLTGSLGDAGLQLTERFDLKGIISIVLQILGLTWANIRAKLVKRLGEKPVAAAEKTVDIVKKIITQGPLALWEMIKEKAAEIKEKVLEGIRNWAIIELVKAGIIKLIMFLNPAGAIVQAILAIYNTIMFFVENWRRIVEFVKTVFDSIADIAMGKVGTAAAAVEKALAMTIPIILNFLARLIPLTGIGKAVKGVITKIRKPIDNVIDKAVDFIAKKAKGLFAKGKALVAKGKAKAAEVKKKLFEWWRLRKKFTDAGGESHTLFFKGKAKGAPLLISSQTPQTIEAFLASLGPGADQAKLSQAKVLAGELITITRQDVKPEDREKITAKMTKLTGLLIALGGGTLKNLPQTANWSSPMFKGKRVEKLSTKTSKAGPKKPSGTDKGWRLIQNPVLGPPQDWVRMHLLSAAIGGSSTPDNWVPAPTAVNTGSQAVSFESSLKDLVVKKGRTNMPNVVWAQVHAHSFHPASTPPVPVYDSTTFVDLLKMRAGLHFFQNSDWTLDNTERVSEDIKVPPPVFVTGKIESINEIGRVKLAAITGIDPNIAFEITQEKSANGKFNNYLYLLRRMIKSRDDRKVKVTEEFKRDLDRIYDAVIAGKITFK